MFSATRFSLAWLAFFRWILKVRNHFVSIAGWVQSEKSSRRKNFRGPLSRRSLGHKICQYLLDCWAEASANLNFLLPRQMWENLLNFPGMRKRGDGGVRLVILLGWAPQSKINCWMLIKKLWGKLFVLARAEVLLFASLTPSLCETFRRRKRRRERKKLHAPFHNTQFSLHRTEQPLRQHTKKAESLTAEKSIYSRVKRRHMKNMERHRVNTKKKFKSQSVTSLGGGNWQPKVIT